ncbi:EAL domain-containing protein [Marinicella gelatinilytica]|uniref:EAL domain-containing protein n=1 Tax=Marinicella gelatinilytica TaxID=2996017 RepID=UPI002260F50A|nr:EAL domain-containing protein [Marinicella gelatinilytica]MCX7544665.1 EAL domain-containing protein [Marinicella gelatinilytica]
MIISSVHRWILFFALCLINNTCYSVASKSVDLQLRWTPSFQFAGFYAAQQQNLYQQNGLQVSIHSGFNEDGEFVSPIDSVRSGEAVFGVDDLHLLEAIDDGAELVILAPIMQHTAAALVTTADNPIHKIHDLVGKTLKTGNNHHLVNELKVLLAAHQISQNDIKFKYGDLSLSDLDSGDADVLLTYGVNAEFNTIRQQFPISVTYLSDIGSAFYGNVLFTHQSTINKYPDKVREFLEASIQGWQYALTHEQQLIDYIGLLDNHKVAVENRDAYNLHYAQQMKKYMQWPDVAVGSSSTNRWHQIYNDLQNNNLLNRQWNIEDYLYSPKLSVQKWGVYIIICIIFVLAIYMAIQFHFLNEYRYVFVIGLLVIAVLYILTEYNMRQRYGEILRYEALQTAQDLNTDLANRLNNNVILLKNLATYIAFNPSLSDAEFSAFCGEVFEQGESLINLAAAPDLIIKMVYPLHGNEAILNVDYRNVKSQNKLVMRALTEQKTVFSNPLQLIQGGRGLVIRQGVMTSQTHDPWGVVAAVVDINQMFKQVGVFEASKRFNIVIKSNDNQQVNYVVYGNPYNDKHGDSLSVAMNVIDNKWNLHISPIDGWTLASEQIWLFRLLAVLFVLIWFFRVQFLLRRKQYRNLIQQEVKTHETLLHEVGAIAKIAAWRVNEKGDILQWTAKGNDIIGHYVPHKITHVDDFWQLFNNELTESFKTDIIKAGLYGEGFDVEVPYHDDEGQRRWLRVVSAQTIDTAHGKEIIGAIQDITEYKDISELIQYQATHDNLTGLYNRSAFVQQTKECLKLAEKNNAMVALIFIDLDNFKNINDSLGHGCGDQVLAEFANIIKTLSDHRDVLSRYSGDEFVILTSNTAYGLLKSKVNTLLENLNQPLSIQGQSIFISASIGVSVYPDHAISASDLMVCADLAMYEAKKRGKNNACIFNADMQKHAQRQIYLKNTLQLSVESNSIEVYYQPIINTDNNKVIKIEALMRCPDPEGGFFNTEELIQICEETSTIFEIDIAVIKQVFTDLDLIKAQCNQTELGISLNVSPNIFSCQTHLLSEWLYWLYQLAAKISITLEITERALLNNSSTTLSVFDDFKERGIDIAIDDFGVGYSSLSTLVDFPITMIKIDRSFIDKLEENDFQYRQIISSVVNLAGKLKLEVIAEGVETVYQVNELKHYGCHNLQGYYFSKPLDKQAVIDFINNPQWLNRDS